MFAANDLFSTPPQRAPYSAISAKQSALASGTPFTWSSGGGIAGSYGIVFVECQSGGLLTLAATASVTWGGTAMTSLGGAYNNNNSTNGWGRVFVLPSIAAGGAGIPAGPQTISVTLTQTGETFTGYGSSYSYNNISAVGTLQTANGDSTSPSLSVSAANADTVWGAILTNNFALSGFSLTPRQHSPLGPFFWAGDTTGSTSVTVSGTNSGTVWSAFGLDLRVA